MARRCPKVLNLSAAVLLLAATACERALPTESRGSPGAASRDAAPSVPFRLVLTGNADPKFLDQCKATNAESGTGVAEHLGNVTWSSSEVVNFCAEGGPSVAGTIVITAANGDQLTESYSTTLTIDGTTLTATGPYRVTGGTGRFSDATGSGTIDVTGSLLPPFGVSGTYTGTIAY